MVGTFKTLLSMIIVSYVMFGLLIYFFQRSFLYFPHQNVPPEHNYIPFAINDQIVNVVVVNKGNKQAVLYFGGNAETVAFSAEELAANLPGKSVYLVNYRGYGGSTGNPTEEGLKADAEAIFDNLLSKHETVSVIGRSLGSGIAVHLASMRPVHKLILVTPYDSILHLARDIYPIYPVSIMLKDKFLSIDKVDKIEVSTLAIVAENDSVISYEYSRNLIDAFPKQLIQLEMIEGADHNNLSNYPLYYQSIRKFL